MDQKKSTQNDFTITFEALNIMSEQLVNIIFFLSLLQDSTITGQSNLKVNLFDLFGYLSNFFKMFDIYIVLISYTLRIILLIFFIVYSITAQECTRSLSLRDAG